VTTFYETIKIVCSKKLNKISLLNASPNKKYFFGDLPGVRGPSALLEDDR
jgi:hypothetical protein